MERFQIDELLDRQPKNEGDYTEFLRQESMSVGVYTLPEGSVDTQDPHTEDEIYYVLSGSATLIVDGDEYQAEKDDVFFVERDVEHRFIDIKENLELLVVFAPERGSLSSDS